MPEQHPAGRREKLELGTLFLPVARPRAILFFFHGGTWLPEVAAARNRMAVVTVQAGVGIGRLTRASSTTRGGSSACSPKRRRRRACGSHASCWAAGAPDAARSGRSCKAPEAYARVDAVLVIDGIHTDYVEGKPGPLESKIGTENLEGLGAVRPRRDRRPQAADRSRTRRSFRARSPAPPRRRITWSRS